MTRDGAAVSSREQVSTVMAEVGPLVDLAAVSEYDEDGGVWTLTVDEETTLVAEWDEAGRALVLSAEAGRPPAGGDRLALYELLLEYNGQWRESGGLVLTLDEPGGVVVQHCRLNAEGLDAGRLAGTVAGFVEALLAWRGIVTRPSADVTGARTALPFDPFSMIRG